MSRGGRAPRLLEPPADPTNPSYLALLRHTRAGESLWFGTCSIALLGSFYGTIDGVLRNYHVGLAGLRAGLNLGTLTFSILTLRDFAFVPAKTWLQCRHPLHFPRIFSEIDPANASPRAHNLPDAACSGAVVGGALSILLKRPRPLRAAFTMTLGVTLTQYVCNELYLQQIRYIAWSNARAVSKIPLVTFKQRVKDVYYGAVTWLYTAAGMEKIPDDEYLLEQLVKLEQVKEDEARAQRDLAQLEALLASLSDAPKR